jgi:predicted Zn-dependent peptidase
MKRIITVISLAMLALMHATPMLAQQKAPYDMMVEGVKVIVQPSGNEIVEIQAVFKGGVQNYPENKAGIEKMAFQALTECGTAADDKNSWKNKLDKVSASVYGSSGMDLSRLNLNCIRSDFDVAWPLYADALTRPRFDEKEFERIRQDAINEIKANESSPDYAISKYARKLAFNGKNYAKDPEGTEATIRQLTLAEVKQHYTSILTRSRMFIVVVGEFDRADLEKRLAELIRRIPAGGPVKFVKESYAPAKNSFSATQKDFATNYIQGITGAPKPGDPDFDAFNLAMRMFADKYFIEVRTKNGLSYAPQAWFDGSMTPTANIAVSTTEPDKYIAVTQALIDKIKKEGFSAEEVRNEKIGYVTGIYYRNEMNASQASSLATNEALFGNWRRAVSLKDEINRVKVEDVNKAFNKYFNNLTWAYMGNPAKVNPKLFTEAASKQAPASTLKKGKKG